VLGLGGAGVLCGCVWQGSVQGLCAAGAWHAVLQVSNSGWQQHKFVAAEAIHMQQLQLLVLGCRGGAS
jgi:hypothetical protein